MTHKEVNPEENTSLDLKEETNMYFSYKDPNTGRKYAFPDMTDNVDLIKIVRDSEAPNSIYPVETKIAAAAMYVVVPSSYKIGAHLGISPDIVRKWYHKPWWHVAVREVRKLKNEELDGTLTDLLEGTVTEIADRVQNGEEVIDNKTGKLKRVPMRAKDLATVMGIAYDKRAILRADPNAKTNKSDTQEHLEKVAERLEKLVGKIPEPTIVDGEFTEVED